MRSTPGSRFDARRSRTSASTLRLNSATPPNASTEIATIACPVLVGVVSSALKSTTSRPIAAPLSVPDKQPDDEREPVALVVADRQQETFVGALRIGQRLALAVHHPADRHRLAALRLRFHLAVGRDGRRHVEHDRRLFARGHRDRERIGREQHVEPAPRRQVVRAADRHVDPDHVVLERHARVERRRSRVVAPVRADPRDARRLRLLDRDLASRSA